MAMAAVPNPRPSVILPMSLSMSMSVFLSAPLSLPHSMPHSVPHSNTLSVPMLAFLSVQTLVPLLVLLSVLLSVTPLDQLSVTESVTLSETLLVQQLELSCLASGLVLDFSWPSHRNSPSEASSGAV
jgi:hypothetical protein